jgi:hypothetical protein
VLKEIQKILYSTEVRRRHVLLSNGNSDTHFAHRKDLRYQRRWWRTKRSRLLADLQLSPEPSPFDCPFESFSVQHPSEPVYHTSLPSRHRSLCIPSLISE